MVCGVCSPNFASPAAMAMPGSVSDAAEIVFASFLVMVTEPGAESTQSVVPASFKFLYPIEGDCEASPAALLKRFVFLKTQRATVGNVDRMAATTYRPSPLNFEQLVRLGKPRVVALIVFTAVIGMFLATPGLPPPGPLVFGATGIALVATSAAALNCLIEQKLDAMMARTRARPLPKGDVTPLQASVFVAVVGGAGLLVLHSLTNPLTMWLTLATFLGYAIIYTIFLKPVTPGDRFTRLHVLLYTLILSATSLLPFASGMSGTIYLASALALNGVFVAYAVKLCVNYSDGLARRTFRYSIVYLSCLFAVLLIDHYWRLG